MGINTKIINAQGREYGAQVTKYGQVVTAPVAYSQASSVTLGIDNVPANLIVPEAGNLIVITDILLYANRNVNQSVEATVQIYESSVGPDSSSVTSNILTTEMSKQTSRDLIGINLVTGEGTWVNATTSDDDIFCTVMFYYLPISIRND